MRIGVDTGGTFTDLVRYRGSRIEILKVFSTPGSAPAGRGTLDAIGQLLVRRPQARPAAALPAIVHGTTVGTNALLERRGARVALITTAGFEDLIEIGRQNRERLYDLNLHREPPLVPRSLRFGVAERTAADGTILLRPTPRALRKLREAVIRSGAESVAVCLLFSYANPSNERAIARALLATGLPLSVSHELLPEFREYERLSTTVINAYLATRVGGYLRSLEREARRRFAPRRPNGGTAPDGTPTPLYVMQSSGGITTARRAAREPVRTILSGPAGGVVASAWLGELLGLQKLISLDMGGTSTDVCLLEGGAHTTRETTLAGLPIAVPVLNVHSVGAGGGSIARLDAGDALRVGPASAGASPGPVCYGRGGSELTITDAHLILGRLDPELFLGGEFRLDCASTERRFDDFLRNMRRQRKSIGGAWTTREELASGIVAVGNATMEKALRVISIERGSDPREFSLVSFGGAGGLHAAELARSMNLARVIVPSNPGAFSALGVLLSDVVADRSQSVLLPVPIRAATVMERGKTDPFAGESRLPAPFLQLLENRFAGIERQARLELRRDGFEAGKARLQRSLEMRYRGQSYELAIPYTRQFAMEFHAAHQRAYGYADPVRPLEIVNIRVRLVIPTPKPLLRRQRLVRNPSPRAALVKTAPVWFSRRAWPTPFYDRERLRAGMSFRGPAIVTEYSATTAVPPGFSCRVDEFQNLVLTYDAS